MDADALSTAVFALGREKGGVLAEAHGAGAIFIFEDKTIRTSSVEFTLTDTGYRLVEL
jgi:thiamine biosynthesis lipoprotein ApbE